jgi:hypothetical protein
MATNDARPQPQQQPQGQAQGQALGQAGQATGTPRQMEGQTQPAAPQQGSTPLRDWASI